jgi:NAD+--asparagine ADP-ribosyltransferase
MKIIDQTVLNPDSMKKSNKHIYDRIHKRALQLTKKYPEKKSTFENYMKSQEEENTLLEENITCVTWLLGKKLD